MDPQTQKKSASPLPYVIVFALLFLVMLVVLAWVLDMYKKVHNCATVPNIWCFDTWVCNNSCPAGPTGTAVDPSGNTVNGCFTNATNPTGLSSCLFGPESIQATLCFNENGTPTGGVACDCTELMQSQLVNCLSNCPRTIDDVPDNAVCCAKGSTNAECNSAGT